MIAKRALVLLALLALLPVARASAARVDPTREQCIGAAAVRSVPPVINRDPKPGAPRVFAMQVKLDPADVVTRAAFERKVECLLRDYVLPYRAKGRPNVVAFDENAGLLTGATGRRFAGVRRIASNPLGDAACAGQPSPCRAISLLSAFEAVQKPERAFYGAGPTGLSAPFVLATDAIARTFMGTFSRAAKRHGLYVIAANFQPRFRQTRARRAVRALAPSGARSAYVATSDAVYNEVFAWGPNNVRRRGPDVLRNVLGSNRKVPLTPIEQAIGLKPGPGTRANLAPVRLPGTRARLGFATSLPAFRYGGRTTEPCEDVAATYMRCLDTLGANVVIQADANPGPWTGPDGDGIEQWQPLSWMLSTWRAVTDPSVSFAYNVTPMLTGNVADLVFDGQTAITQRGGTRGPGCHYIGNGSFDPAEDRPDLTDEAGPKTEFLGIAPWVVGDRSRNALRAVQARLDPLTGDALTGDYVETAVIADLPFPVDTKRRGCAQGGR